jgi:hypothetical protein
MIREGNIATVGAANEESQHIAMMRVKKQKHETTEEWSK